MVFLNTLAELLFEDNFLHKTNVDQTPPLSANKKVNGKTQSFIHTMAQGAEIHELLWYYDSNKFLINKILFVGHYPQGNGELHHIAF